MILPNAMMNLAPASAETELVNRAIAGEPSALDELVDRYRRPAYFLALQLLGNRDDALDVAQDAMIRLISTLHRFDSGRPVRPWLNQIVRNRVIDLFRRRKVRSHESLDDVDDEGGPRFEPIDPSVDLDGDLERSRLRSRVWRALQGLSEAHREILVLRDYQDLSYQEIANTVSIPLGTVMSRLHGARKALRKILRDEPLRSADLA